MSPDFHKISNNESMPSSSRKSGFAFQAGGRTDDEKRDHPTARKDDQIDEEEIEETMEDDVGPDRSSVSKRRRRHNNDEDREPLEDGEEDLGTEEAEKLKEKQVASYVKLRTEICK